jgi:single-strand DNA-binding protein
MSDLNCTIITGRLGADPETRRKQDGSPIVNLRVACAETWRDKNNGERKERTEWFTVVIFSEGLCKIAEQYLKKGSKVLLQGKIATRKWQDKDGNDRFSTELILQGFDAKLIMLDGPSDKPKDEPRQSYSEPSRPSLQDDMDGDTIPF